MIRSFSVSIAALFLAILTTNPVLAGCRGGTFVTFENNTKYCVWATLYYSYVMQAGWKIERAHEVVPRGSWSTWIAFNYPDLGPQIGTRAEVMNYTNVPCKGSPNVADVRSNEDVPRAKVNGNWQLAARKATINEANGRFTIGLGLGPYPQSASQCGI
jgi:hypothetical protein